MKRRDLHRNGSPIARSGRDRAAPPSVPTMMRQRPRWSLRLRAEVTTSHGYAEHSLRKSLVPMRKITFGIPCKTRIASRAPSPIAATSAENATRHNIKALRSESVREHHAGLHSFRIMRRIEASLRKARAFRVRHFQSLASRRHRPSHANVRSTTHRFGSTTKPLA